MDQQHGTRARTSGAYGLLVAIALSLLLGGCAGASSPSGRSGIATSTSTAAASVTSMPEPGETWGGFVFVTPGVQLPAATVSPPAGKVPNEELIPADYPGTATFASPAEAVRSGGLDAALAVVPSFIPPGYELAGVYVVRVDSVGVVDYALSYRRTDLPRRTQRDELFAPDLWVGWTLRTPRPLAVPLDDQDLGDGRVGRGYAKTEVASLPAVFQAWENAGRVPRSLRILSVLAWFDNDGRQWWVQAEQPLPVLRQVAASLRP